MTLQSQLQNPPSQEDNTPAEQTVEERLKEIEAQNKDKGDAQKNLNLLLADKDIQRLITLKQQGKVVSIEEDKGPDNPPAEEEDLDDGLDDEERVTLKKEQKVDERLARIVKEDLGPLIERIVGLEGLAQKVEASDVAEDVEAARKKFSDFDDFAQPILELHKKMPGASVEQLYVMAKVEGNSPIEPQRGLESEPPSSTTPRAFLEPRKTPLPQGKAGVRQLLREGRERRDGIVDTSKKP